MKISRQEATKELEKRGYKPDKGGRGVWFAPNGDRLAWIIALRQEDIEFDISTWGPKMTRVKKAREEKKEKRQKKKTKNGFPIIISTLQS